MCGIVGIISKQGTLSYYCQDLFTNMLRMDSLRGPDSTGCFGITSNAEVDMLKGDADGWLFTTTTQYGSFKKRIDKNYKVVIGHNRKATSGSVNASNAHPFQHQQIMMVHNGAIKNAKGIAETEVDSEAIAHALAKNDAVTALGKLDGAYAIVWWDGTQKTISLARNKERPLFLLEYPFMWVIASEPGLPVWLNGREGRKPDKMDQIPTEKIFTFDLDNLSKGYKEVGYEEYKAYTPVKYKHTWSPPSNIPFNTNSNNVTDLHPIAPHSTYTPRQVSQPFKQGDFVEFELDDEHQENGSQILLGHPIIDGEKREDIIVRHVLQKGDNPLKYFGLGADAYTTDRWKALVHHCRQLVGTWVVYVGKLEPFEIVMDAQLNEHEAAEAEQAIKAGCSKCQGSMTLEDVPQGIVRKKSPSSGGGWRIVCPKCLNKSIEEAKAKRPEAFGGVQ